MRISDWSSDVCSSDLGRQRVLKQELEWIRQSPRARQAKSKASVQAYESLVAQAADKAPEPGSISIPAGPRLGDLVIEAQHIGKAFGARKSTRLNSSH